MPSQEKIAVRRDSMQSDRAGSGRGDRAMSVRAVITTIACLLPLASPASSKPLQPTEKWHVFFDETQCLAQRNYGTEGDPVFLVLKQPPLGEVMQIAVAVDRPDTNASEVDGRVSFGANRPHKVSFLVYGPPKQDLRFYTANLPIADIAEARSATTLRIAVQELDKTFAISNVGDLLKIMDTCVTDLRKYWNLDSNSGDRLAKRARGSLQRLFSSDDYPTAALMNGETGHVKVAVLLNEQGKVADCSVIETSGVAALDAQTCAAIRTRAKFTPAMGKDGKPAKDGFVQVISWDIG
jgi:TonB family protein